MSAAPGRPKQARTAARQGAGTLMSAAPGRPEQARTAARQGEGSPVNTAPRRALVMAGGTGGHIFPGLAVAIALRERGWTVVWLGGKGSRGRPSMESRLVPAQGFAFEVLDFGGLRGKGGLTALLLPARLLRAFWQSIQVLRRHRPDVVIGLGGYISFPAGMMGVLLGTPLVLHEQNSVAGMANRVLSKVADRVFSAFPSALARATWIGNPLRAAFCVQPEPAQRFAQRSGALRLLVIGGSQGARVLNDTVPRALALLPMMQRPQVRHQGGAGQLDPLRAAYAAAGVQGELTEFIEDTAQAFADADLVLCRAGASTVTEVAAVGAAAAFVPLPTAVDDHQTCNARFLVDQGAAWLLPQNTFNAQSLATFLLHTDRAQLLERALRARAVAQTGAVAAVVAACEELVGA